MKPRYNLKIAEEYTLMISLYLESSWRFLPDPPLDRHFLFGRRDSPTGN